MTRGKRQLGVVMDPIDQIKPAKDSTLAMLLAAQRRGWDLVYFQQGDLAIRDGVPMGQGLTISVQDEPDDWYRTGAPWQGSLADLDVILMRKDPPFDMEYIYTTYLLELAEARGTLIVNRPASLRDINEKVYTAWFPNCTPPSLITRSQQAIKEFLEAQGHIVVKPLDGMGGRSIFSITQGDPNTNVILETMTDYGHRYTLAQRYLPEIADGDKRILLLDGKPVPYALARIPAADDGRGNLVMGATGEGRPLTDQDRRVCEQLGPTLKAKGIMFAGLDVIGDFVTEINVTSPTGIRELDRQFDLDIAAMLMDVIDSKLSG